MTQLTIDHGDLILTSPFNRGLVDDIKATIPYHDRQYLPDGKQWRIKYAWGNDIADMVKRHLGETIAVPKQVTQAADKPVTRLFQIEYIGSVKDRDDGSQTATGYANGQWCVIFPFEVLRGWFNDEAKPNEAPTFYAVLGIKAKATPEEVKKAYRLAARTWHPDVNKDPDAANQFIRIQAAYEVLSDAQQRRKYDAGLIFERDAARHDKRRAIQERYGWSPPVRCGWVTLTGTESVGRFIVASILSWQPIVNSQGQSLVTYWQKGQDTFSREWL